MLGSVDIGMSGASKNGREEKSDSRTGEEEKRRKTGNLNDGKTLTEARTTIRPQSHETFYS